MSLIVTVQLVTVQHVQHVLEVELEVELELECPRAARAARA